MYTIVTGKYEKNYHLDISKYFFSNGVVAVWNSLPDYVVTFYSIVLFEKRLDKFRSNQSIYFNFEAELKGTGSRSIFNVQFDVDKEA